MALKNSGQVSNAGSWKHGSAESPNGRLKELLGHTCRRLVPFFYTPLVGPLCLMAYLNAC